MSPQLRLACMKESTYNPFKADVFALGASILHMLTLNSPEPLLTSDQLDETVGREIVRLPCSKQLQNLLISMLAYEEGQRLTMQEVCIAISKEAELPESLADMQTALDLHGDVFAAFYCDAVELYDISSRQSTKHSLSVDFGMGGSFISLDRNTWLCIGARPPTTSVYSFDLFSLQLTSLPSLHTTREGAGLSMYADFVYVFGGWSGTTRLASCEKYNLRNMQWFPLGNMRYSRGYFTPCTYLELIYLVCPYRPVESFNPMTEIFVELSVSMPAQSLRHGSVAFVTNGELCLLTENKELARWKVESEGGFRISSMDRECWGSQAPLIVNSQVLIACKGQVEKFSLETYSFI